MSQPKKKRIDSSPVDKAPGSKAITTGRQGRRIAFIIGSVVIALILIAVGVSIYFSEDARYKRLTIITVDDTSVPMDYFLKRIKLAGVDSFTMLDTLTDEQIIKLGAPDIVGEVSLENIDQQLRIIARGESETISESEFEEWYRQQLNETGLSDSEYTEIISTGILATRLYEYLAKRMPTVVEHVHLHGIILGTREDAEEVWARWEAGEDFADLAREVSLDVESGEKDGDLGWVPLGITDIVDFVALEFSSGDVSQPLQPDLEEDIHYILMWTEKAQREVEEDYLQAMRDKMLDGWLLAERQSHEIEWAYNSEIDAWIDWQLAKE